MLSAAGLRDNGGDIRADKVLLIVNSDNAWSGTAADYYQAAHKLNPAHRLEYSFGSQTTLDVTAGTDGPDGATLFTNVVTPVAQYILANDIDAVICCLCPRFTTSAIDPTHGTRNLSLAGVLGGAVNYYNWGQIPQASQQPGGTSGGWAYLLVGTHRDGSNMPSINPAGYYLGPPYDTFNNGSIVDGSCRRYKYGVAADKGIIPWGSLGDPYTLDEAAYNKVVKCVDNALAGAPKGAIHVGVHDRVISAGTVTNRSTITGYQGYRVIEHCKNYGASYTTTVRSFSSSWPVDAPNSDHDIDEVMAGTANITAWGMVGAAIMNAGYGADFVNSFTWPKGSWGYEATSTNYGLIRSMMEYGEAAGGVVTIFEPFSHTIPFQDLFAEAILQGYSLSMAMVLSRAYEGWAVDCWGDPLYQPFGDQIIGD